MRERSGFALVVSITMLILLTVLALGMLGLSSIALRAASFQRWLVSNGNPESVARLNLAVYGTLTDPVVMVNPGSRPRVPPAAMGSCVPAACPPAAAHTPGGSATKIARRTLA